jgi:hypothetical protein
MDTVLLKLLDDVKRARNLANEMKKLARLAEEDADRMTQEYFIFASQQTTIVPPPPPQPQPIFYAPIPAPIPVQPTPLPSMQPIASNPKPKLIKKQSIKFKEFASSTTLDELFYEAPLDSRKMDQYPGVDLFDDEGYPQIQFYYMGKIIWRLSDGLDRGCAEWEDIISELIRLGAPSRTLSVKDHTPTFVRQDVHEPEFTVVRLQTTIHFNKRVLVDCGFLPTIGLFFVLGRNQQIATCVTKSWLTSSFTWDGLLTRIKLNEQVKEYRRTRRRGV